MRDRIELEEDYKEYLESGIENNLDGYYIGQWRIMTFDQQEIMRKYAECVIDGRNDVRLLEIGYGLGVFTDEAEKIGTKEHVIIECHPKICAIAREKYNKQKHIKIFQGFWQEFKAEKRYDAIFYDCTVIGKEVDAVDELLQFIEFSMDHFLTEDGIISFWYQGNKIDYRILDFFKDKSINYKIILSDTNKKPYLIFKLNK